MFVSSSDLIFSYLDPMCVYASFGPSSAIMGLPSGIWRPSECPLRYRTTTSHTGRRYELSIVSDPSNLFYSC